MSRGAACPDEPPTEANQYQTRCTASGPTPIQPDGTSGRASSPDVQKSPAWCMIRAKQMDFVRLPRMMRSTAAYDVGSPLLTPQLRLPYRKLQALAVL